MPVVHTRVPIKGLITDAPSTMIDKMASTGMRAIRIHNGVVEKDCGYSKYPSDGNYLDGNPVMKVQQFFMEDATTQLLALTTKNAFKYNTTLKSWQCISNAAVAIEDCEDVWTNPWGKITTMGVCLPDAEASDAWTDTTAGTGTLARTADSNCFCGYRATLSSSTTAVTDSAYYTHAAGSAWASVDNATGYVIRFRTKIVSSGSAYSMSVRFRDGDYECYLIMSDTDIAVYGSYISEATQTYTMDTTDDYHVYEIVVKGTALKIYVDGTERITGTLDSANANKILTWGDSITMADAGGVAYWDYICYHITDNTRYHYLGDITTTSTRVGTNCMGIKLGAGFTTGLTIYEDIANADYDTGYTGIHFWIKSSVATVAGDLTIRLSDANDCSTEPNASAPFEVPALVANTWTGVYLARPGDYYSSTEAVGVVVATDNGEQTIYIDDIKAVNAFTGDESDRWSTTTMNNTYIATNSEDQPQKYIGTGVFTDMTTTLNTGTLTEAKMVFTFKDHLCFANTQENSVDIPNRVTWTNIGTIEDLVGGTAGYQDLNDNDSFIMSAKQYGDDRFFIYKERSITHMTWVGGATPFRFTPMVDSPGAGTYSLDGVINTGGEHVVFGKNYIYAYNGGTTTTMIDDAISRFIYNSLNTEYINRVFTYFNKDYDEMQFWIPTSGEHVDTAYCMDVKIKNWYVRNMSVNCIGEYYQQSSLTFGDIAEPFGLQDWTFGSAKIKSNVPILLLGNYSGYVNKENETTYNADGVAVECYFDTPDYTIPNEDYEDNKFRVLQFMIEAKGTSATIFYSSDLGNSWYATQGNGTNTISLDSNWKLYRQDFDGVFEHIRFRVCNYDSDSGFKFRYYGFKWLSRSRL